MDVAFEQPGTDGVPAGAASGGQFVTFTCGDRALAVDIMTVREIRGWIPTTQLPGQTGANSVLDIRGEVVRIYDLAEMIGAYASDSKLEGKVVMVVSVAGENVGLIVDSVSDIVFVGPEDMRPVPKPAHGDRSVRNLIKVQSELVSILDIEAIFGG